LEEDLMRRDMLVDEVMRRGMATVDTDRPITHALRLMRKNDVDGVVVIEDGKLVGVATYWDFMVRLGNLRVRSADPSSIYVSSVMNPPRATLTPETPIVEAARLVVEEGAYLMPVLEEGSVVGALEAKDLAKALLDEEVPALNVSMRSPPTVNLSDRVIHARKVMMDSGLRSLATLNEGAVVGVVNDDQIVEAYLNLIMTLPMERQKAQIRHLLIADVGPRHVKAHAESSLGGVAEVMVKNPVKGVPVVDEDRVLVGFVSVLDVARFVMAQA